MTLDEVGALADLLRAKGVRLFKSDECEMELGPALVPDDGKPAVPEPDLCKCGHPEYFHINGLCSQGCAAETCSPEAPQ